MEQWMSEDFVSLERKGEQLEDALSKNDSGDAVASIKAGRDKLKLD
jgi:hypothetical protein